MVINISVQYSGGLLPDIILWTQGYYQWGTRLNTMWWLCTVFTTFKMYSVYATTMCDGVLHCLVFNVFLVSLHAINVNVQYNGGFLPDIILLTRCYLHRGTCLNAMKRFCICSL